MPLRNQPEICPTPPVRRRRRRSPLIAVAAVGGLVLAGLAISPAYASHVPFGTSSFEIDTNANLVVDHAGNLDWATVTEVRKPDKASGSGDDSFGQGSKEDTPVPTVVSGSIPPNKSDLKNFGLYLETKGDGHQYLHLFWHRVQDPTGTTNMDFEFNKSKVLSANGVTPVRTSGDLLIQYDLSNGGTNPQLSVSSWVTTGAGSQCEASNSVPCWGKRTNFTALGLATGSINTTAITAGNADGLGAISARTFGEATVDFTALASTLDQCETFGSAYLKSRSSDSFSAAMKDFIAPIETGFPTCGGVIIRKVTDPSPSTEDFSYTKDFSSDPAGTTFTLSDGESASFSKVPINTTGHVSESALPPGWDFDKIDCTASSDGSNVSTNGTTITFSLDTAADTVDCTYYNKARGSITVEKVTDSGQGAFEFTSGTLTSPFTLTTTGAGDAGKDSEQFTNLVPGPYDVAETVPANWHLVSASCTGDDDGTDPATIVLDPGEDVVCTFHNDRNVGAILIEKTHKHAADGPGDHPESGVEFTVTGGGLVDPIVVETGSDGTVCVPGLLVSAFAGTYTVTETVPAGEKVTSDNPQYAAVATSEDDCSDVGAAATVSFTNMPLTNITVSVDSQVDGGTASTIECGASADDPDASTGANGDGSFSMNDLEPGTYVCTVVVDP
ncbi:collagen binding domain-containing protein [Agromyces sp. S2-1-8]|uniref:MSCRAMM family protein n=1 Tax=Agromyces sp. S2-1-8 TaxID=2897180 RepID=UPI001E388714|nr:hypothetical protein [Agromyces sp. S2-1-8]MCD5346325.1 hypothetical protein [Agromyces sp. S2-1-8]